MSVSPPEGASSAEQAKWFAEEVQPYEPFLRGFLRRNFPALRDVDDVVQESFLRTWFARQSGKLTSTKGFLFSAAHNLAISVLRKRGRISNITLNDEEALGVLEEGGDVVETVCTRDELAIVVETIARLPKRCRQIAGLRLMRGMDYRAIAGETGLSEATVRVQMAIAMRKCGEFLLERGVIGRDEP